jgi:hypothetical protein
MAERCSAGQPGAAVPTWPMPLANQMEDALQVVSLGK